MTPQERIEQIVSQGKAVKLPKFTPKDFNPNAAKVDNAWPIPPEHWPTPEEQKATDEAYTKLINTFRQKMIGEDDIALTVATTKIEAEPACPHCGKPL